MSNLAVLYRSCGQYDKAEPLFEKVLSARRVNLPADHPDTLRTMNNLGLLYQDQQRYDQAEQLFREAVAGGKKQLGLGHAQTQWFIDSLVDLYGAQGKPHLAEPALRELADFARGKDGPDSLAYASQLVRLAHNLLQQRKFAEAEPVARNCLTIRAEKEPDAWSTFYSQWLLGGALLAQKKYPEAEPYLVQGYAGLKAREAKLPKNIRDQLTQGLEWLVHLHDARGNKAEADRLRKEWEDEKARQKR
jgi:tetratricopeptide (TPR) repeat protein